MTIFWPFFDHLGPLWHLKLWQHTIIGLEWFFLIFQTNNWTKIWKKLKLKAILFILGQIAYFWGGFWALAPKGRCWRMVFLINSECPNIIWVGKIDKHHGIFCLGCLTLQHAVNCLFVLPQELLTYIATPSDLSSPSSEFASHSGISFSITPLPGQKGSQGSYHIYSNRGLNFTFHMA